MFLDLKPICKPTSCKDLNKQCPSCSSGIYELYFGESIYNIYCDMETDGGRVTVYLDLIFRTYSRLSYTSNG